MSYAYKPRRAPKRFFEGAPEIVRAQVLDFIATPKNAVLDYDVLLSEPTVAMGYATEWPGLDFGDNGWRGQHFFLKDYELRDYRDRNRRKRVRWLDLPEATQRAIVAYLQEEF